MDEQLDYGDEQYGGSQKMQYRQAAAIPALAEEEMIGDDDEYDDLYNDVNVGESFMQMHRPEPPVPPNPTNGGFQALKPKVESFIPQEVNNARAVGNEGNYAPTGVNYPEQKPILPSTAGHSQPMDGSQRMKIEMTHNSQVGNSGYQGSGNMMPHPANQVVKQDNTVNHPAPMISPNMGESKVVQQIPPNMMNSGPNVNINRPMNDEYQVRTDAGNGNTMLFVGELHWWTTDAELESVLVQYGQVKEIKFFDERASGKSKGYCQVEFHDPASAAACKERMDGYPFNGRACVVTFATAQSIKQMGASYNRTQSQTQPQNQGRAPMNDGGRGNGANFPGGDGGRGFGRGGWGRGGNQARGPGAGPIRGRGGNMGNRNMMGNIPGAGNGAYGPGFGGPPGMMNPAMMNPGFDLAYMGRGAGYGGFPGPGYPGMMPPFPNPMGMSGVSPHVNPAFFGQGMNVNAMAMMGNGGMDGPHPRMWSDPNMNGWGGEESNYGGEDNASEYGYAEDKGVKSSTAPKEERNSEREWSSNPEKRRRDESNEGDRYDRDQRHREDKDYRNKDRGDGYDDDYDRGQSSKPRSRSRAVPDENHGSRSRDSDYGKRRRMPSE